MEGNAAKDQPNGALVKTDIPAPKPVDNDQGLPAIDPDPRYMTTEEAAIHLNKLDIELAKATQETADREREMNASISASLQTLLVKAALDRDAAKSVDLETLLHILFAKVQRARGVEAASFSILDNSAIISLLPKELASFDANDEKSWERVVGMKFAGESGKAQGWKLGVALGRMMYKDSKKTVAGKEQSGR